MATTTLNSLWRSHIFSPDFQFSSPIALMCLVLIFWSPFVSISLHKVYAQFLSIHDVIKPLHFCCVFHFWTWIVFGSCLPLALFFLPLIELCLFLTCTVNYGLDSTVIVCVPLLLHSWCVFMFLFLLQYFCIISALLYSLSLWNCYVFCTCMLPL